MNILVGPFNKCLSSYLKAELCGILLSMLAEMKTLFKKWARVSAWSGSDRLASQRATWVCGGGTMWITGGLDVEEKRFHGFV